MRENRTSGSVRGALGNRRSYREMAAAIEMLQQDQVLSTGADFRSNPIDQTGDAP